MGERQPIPLQEGQKPEFGQTLKPRQRQSILFPEGDDLPLLSGTPQQAVDQPFLPEDQTYKQQMFTDMPDIDYDRVRENDHALKRRRSGQVGLQAEGSIFRAPEMQAEVRHNESETTSSIDTQPPELVVQPVPPVGEPPRIVLDQAGNQLQTAIKALEAGIDSIIDSDSFRAYLRTMSAFHDYSFGNVILIGIQRSDATRVAGYQTWKNLGRQVRKGEKAIKIIVPHKKRIGDDDETAQDETAKPGAYRLVGFGVGNVFDVSQTDGKPLPPPPAAEVLQSESDAGTTLYECLETFVSAQGVTVVRKDTGQAKGYYDPVTREIAVRDDLRSDAAAKTLAHEAAHFMANHRELDPKQDVETVAESTAFVLMHHFGIDTSSYSFGYVAGWAQDRQVLQRNLDIIQKTAHQLISGVEGLLAPAGQNES